MERGHLLFELSGDVGGHPSSQLMWVPDRARWPDPGNGRAVLEVRA